MIFSQYFDAWASKYYANVAIGADFYTAINASKFFGGAIAKYILYLLESASLSLPLNIIDFGGNNANLLNDIHSFLESLGLNVAKECNFILIDKNARFIKSNKHLDSIKFYENLASLKEARILKNHNCIFVANELFDALPCEIVDGDKMAFVENHSIIFKPHNNQKILEICTRFNIQRGEIPLCYEDICKEVASLGVKFIFMAFDYGDNIVRNDFTMRIFHRHSVKNIMEIPLKEHFGVSDITYNVPFFLLDRAFEMIVAERILSKRLDLALVEDFGILEILQDFYAFAKDRDEALYLRESNKIKSLLHILAPKFSVKVYGGN